MRKRFLIVDLGNFGSTLDLVVAVHDVLSDKMLPVPDPNRKLADSDTLLVAGHPEALEKLALVR